MFSLSSRWRVERSIEIDASPDAVYHLIASFKDGWSRWNPFVEPHHELSYSGAASGVGSILHWKDGRRGGSLTMREADPRAGVVYDMEFEGMKLTGRIAFARGTPLRVTLSDEGDCGRNPLLWIMSFFADRVMGPTLAKGLETMKAKAEARSAAPSR
ncbi:MAG: SRPBCC family protein [Planctomycetota bacterium]